MRRAEVFVHNISAGYFEEKQKGEEYIFIYHENYSGEPVSLTMPLRKKIFNSKNIFPFFEGLLPEGPQLESLLRIMKIDRDDLFGQLIAVGQDTVGAVTIRELE
jgi:serine/threonine-protein kinase HipA